MGDFDFYQSHFLVKYLYFYSSMVFEYFKQHCLQVKHFVQNNLNNFEILPQEHCVYVLTKQHHNFKHLISTFVSLFSKSSIPSTNHIKSSWEADKGGQKNRFTQISQFLMPRFLKSISKFRIDFLRFFSDFFEVK